MPYTPTDPEGQALHQLAIALRPDWTRNDPGSTWYTRTGGSFPHAENYLHCVHALIAYATEPKDSKSYKRTPDLYPEDGRHWEATRPTATPTDRPGRESICQDHTAYSKRTCPICADEIDEGKRTPDQRGKKIRQIVPSPGIRTRQPEPSPTRASMKESET